MNLDQRYDNALGERKAGKLARQLPESPIAGVDFTCNDYLCLSQHPKVVEAAAEAAKRFGVGGRASRLLGAEASVARDLESKIAAQKSLQGRALVFQSGFQLNQAVVSTLLNSKLLDENPLVFADRMIHASLHAGIQTAGVRQLRFNHNDMTHLESLLKKQADSTQPKFVFVESIYGMDGDLAPIDRLYELKAKYGFYLYVDEAHAIGVAGPSGFGLADQSEDRADIVIGTFSKALGSAGGFVVCSEIVRELLVNFAPGFIYSTAPSPVALAAARAAWDLIPELEDERRHLKLLSEKLRNGLQERTNFEHGPSESNIIPVMVGDSENAIALASTLEAAGLKVACIRPPTVPPNTARLRVSLHCGHTEHEIEAMIKLLANC